MAGESAAFRSLEPEVQHRIIRQMVQGNPLNSAFNSTLQTVQTSDFAARQALQVRDSMLLDKSDMSDPSMDEVISYGMDMSSPEGMPLESVPEDTGLSPTNANPAYGKEFSAPLSDEAGNVIEDTSSEGVDDDLSRALALTLGGGATAFAVRDEILTRRGKRPRVTHPRASRADSVTGSGEFALTGGQGKGQLDLLDGSVTPNERLLNDAFPDDMRQSDMQLGDPRQMELDLSNRPPDEITSVDAGKPRIRAKNVVANDLPDEIVEAAIVPKEYEGAERRINKRVPIDGYDGIPAYTGAANEGGQNVERLRGYSAADGGRITTKGQEDLVSRTASGSERRQRARDGSSFKDGDALDTGQHMRTVTNVDGTKTNINIDHPRWTELELRGAHNEGNIRITIDDVSGRVYDKRGFQITDTISLQRLKATLAQGGHHIKGGKKTLNQLAKAIKIIF